MSKLAFSSKAKNLAILEKQLQQAEVLPQLLISLQDWFKAKKKVKNLENIPPWLTSSVIVRSSADNEDGLESSLAGKYLSIGNVDGLQQIETAISEVFDSYDDIAFNHCVFIQPMLSNVAISGVAFSREPNSAAHYYVINYDEESGRLDTVTDGNSNLLKTYYQTKEKLTKTKNKFTPIIELLEELEVLFEHDSLDIEFAIDKNSVLYLLQVRPLILNTAPGISLKKQEQLLSNIEQTIARLSKRHPYLLGESGIFGIMPDWNPAEMIGVRPRPLSFSLYRELITDSIWAYQRHNYGYRNLRSFPLLLNFNGFPYVDVRVSFNSFIPADLEDELAEKLVEIYLVKLRDNPNYHDKVEFEIIHSCYTPDLDEQLEYLKNCGFSGEEISTLIESLKSLTDKIIYSKNALWVKDLEKIEKLKNRQQIILNSELNHIDKIYWLLEDCKRYGTLPFAGLARAGFIAVQILKSFVRMELITPEEYDLLLSSKDSISSEMTKDYQNLSHSSFLKKYGHLRPGAYDILTNRYDENPDKYFNENTNNSEPCTFTLNKNVLEIESRLKSSLKKMNYSKNVEELFEFMWGAIKGREYGKFVFTKSLSDILSLLGEWGDNQGVNKEDMSFADIQIIKQFYSCSEPNLPLLKESIKNGKTTYHETCSLQLPALITSHSQVKKFTRPQNDPNYITLGSTTGAIKDIQQDKSEFQGNIIMIPNADPGYDWIFLHKISGFITMYGGVNSHMAIRANELGIPAIIGAGETLYKYWSKAKYLDINCANKTVKVFRCL